MNRYELSIECKACRDGNHNDCSSGKTAQDNIVQIICTCLFCKKNSRQSIMKSNDVCAIDGPIRLLMSQPKIDIQDAIL